MRRSGGFERVRTFHAYECDEPVSNTTPFGFPWTLSAVQIALDEDAPSNKNKHIADALRGAIESQRNQMEKDAKTLAQVNSAYS